MIQKKIKKPVINQYFDQSINNQTDPLNDKQIIRYNQLSAKVRK